MPAVTGAREAEELSRSDGGHAAGWPPRGRPPRIPFQAARDFAANAAHELRTPLTAMRADLDTLRIHSLPDEERDEVIADLLRAQLRVEATITRAGPAGLGAAGTQAEDRRPSTSPILLDRVARENHLRAGRAVDISVEADDDPGHRVWGWPGGPAAGGGQPWCATPRRTAAPNALMLTGHRRPHHRHRRRRRRGGALPVANATSCWAGSRAAAPPRRAVELGLALVTQQAELRR